MPGDPRPGQTGLQEFLKGHAEDHFKVLRRTRTTLLTKEWTPLEPGVIDHKHYRRGVGTVLEQTVKGGDERNVLVSFTAAAESTHPRRRRARCRRARRRWWRRSRGRAQRRLAILRRPPG